MVSSPHPSGVVGQGLWNTALAAGKAIAYMPVAMVRQGPPALHGCTEGLDYCGPDLYDLYVAFQKAYGTAVLRRRRSAWYRKAFLRYFKIYPRKKFWQWLDELNPARREKLQRLWKMGYNEWVRRDDEHAEALLRRLFRSGSTGRPATND